jgi:hypothetical protein
MTKDLYGMQPGRRQFLKGMAVIGGTTVFVAIAKDAVTEVSTQIDETAETKPESKGYHVTPHIEKYYEKARF